MYKRQRLASAQAAASQIQCYAIIALREREENHGVVEEKTDAEGSAANPTPDDHLVEVAQDIMDQLVQQTMNGIQAHQENLVGLLIEMIAQKSSHSASSNSSRKKRSNRYRRRRPTRGTQ